MVGWSLAEYRGDSEKWWGGHWQETEETMTMVGWSLAEDREDSEKWWGGHWQEAVALVSDYLQNTGKLVRIVLPR